MKTNTTVLSRAEIKNHSSGLVHKVSQRLKSIKRHSIHRASNWIIRFSCQSILSPDIHFRRCLKGESARDTTERELLNEMTEYPYGSFAQLKFALSVPLAVKKMNCLFLEKNSNPFITTIKKFYSL
jgi:hypothetical protein